MILYKLFQYIYDLYCSFIKSEALQYNYHTGQLWADEQELWNHLTE